jgi:hypothetical protein
MELKTLISCLPILRNVILGSTRVPVGRGARWRSHYKPVVPALKGTRRAPFRPRIDRGNSASVRINWQTRRLLSGGSREGKLIVGLAGSKPRLVTVARGVRTFQSMLFVDCFREERGAKQRRSSLR